MILNLGIVTMLTGAVSSVLVAARLKGDDKLMKPNSTLYQLVGILQCNQCLDCEANEDSTSVVILINETEEEIIKRAISSFDRLDITHLSENFTQEGY